MSAAAVIAAVACVSHLEEPEGDPKVTTSGTGGPVGQGACYPPSDETTAGVCYVTGPDVKPGEEPGRECLAVRSYTRGERTPIQYRQTWSRSVKPEGAAIDAIYSILANRDALPLPECNMKDGASGYMLLTDWDRSDPDITKQTVRTGFADFVSADRAHEVLQTGLCFAEFMYSDPAHGLAAPGWHVKPVLARRVAEDFRVPDDPSSPTHTQDLQALHARVPEGEGIVYIDEDAGTFHGYAPLAHVVIFDAIDTLIAIPIRDAETASRINDPVHPNCQGRYRGDVLDPNSATPCASAAPSNPPWGCISDKPEDPGGCVPGEGPNQTRGHFRIVDLEMVFNRTLASTLCITYLGAEKARTLGWSDPAWGNNCSGSPQWNPSDPVNGLPLGDWCTATNGPATADCHDSWRSVSYSVSQAFPVQAGTCVPQGQTPAPAL
jgi:hypothetical protein